MVRDCLSQNITLFLRSHRRAMKCAVNLLIFRAIFEDTTPALSNPNDFLSQKVQYVTILTRAAH